MKKRIIALLLCGTFICLTGCDENSPEPEEPEENGKYETITEIPYDRLEYDGENFSIDYVGFFELESDSGYGCIPCSIIHFDFSSLSDDAFYWLTKDTQAIQHLSTLQVHPYITNEENGLDSETMDLVDFSIDNENKTGAYFFGIDKEFKNSDIEQYDMYTCDFGENDADLDFELTEFLNVPQNILDELFEEESQENYDENGSNEQEKSATIGQSNALDSALSYLELTAFSYTGLIEQLEYKGYTTEEATYAADNCGADWDEQAAKAATSYLDLTSFSREGLIEQLEYDGFTHEQAVYGAEENGY